MNKHKAARRLAVLPLMGALLAAGCGGQSAQHVDGLDELGDITAVTREPDSGTRASFDDLCGIMSEDTGLSQVHSTEDVLEEVMNGKSSIGYLTVDAADDSVKALSVNGRAIDDSKYPLTRRLYLVYQGDPSDLEREFITYVTGKGQDLVADYFEPVGKAETFLSMRPSGTLRIGGSSSEAPVMEKLADAYMKENPNADVTVTTTDSGTGINNTLEGTYDLGMSSREPKDYEKSLLTFTPVAKDRIAVIVSSDNPMSDITTDQLKQIYTGKARKWADLNQ